MSFARALLASQSEATKVELLYGVATAANTVKVAGSDVAVTLPALATVVTNDYCAILAAGADRLILGPVGVSTDWEDFTPSWTNLTLGTGATNVGRYRWMNPQRTALHMRTLTTLGTGSSVGSGPYYDFPASASGVLSHTVDSLGLSWLIDANGSIYPGNTQSTGGSSRVYPVEATTTIRAVTSAVPHTWADGDTIYTDHIAEVNT